MYVFFKLQILNWVIIALNYLQYFFWNKRGLIASRQNVFQTGNEMQGTK